MPPPPPPGPPPPPTFGGGAKGGADDRGALLSSIRQGAKLKKTVTVDKSGPYIPGKVSDVSNSASHVGNGVKSGPALQNGGGPPGLGGLFAGGMPKLRPTGKLAGTTPNGQIKNEAPRFPPQPRKTSPEKTRAPHPNVSALSAALSEALGSREPREVATSQPAREPPRDPPPPPPVIKRQPSEVRVRGPPPQPPAQKAMPLSSSDSILTTGSISSEQGLPSRVASTLHRNKSSLHNVSQPASLGGSMTSLTSAPPTPTPSSSVSTSELCDRPRISHGKPNLAPKPPTLSPAASVDSRPSPPPKKLVTNGKIAARAQSMRMPRSPPVSPPSPGAGRAPQPPLNPPIGTKNPASHFGTLRAPRALRPPGVCPPPPPPAPPAPPARHASLAGHPPPPPPPPPHFRQNSTNGLENAPMPPVRGSSMRGTDLEARFGELFHPMTSFPPPDAFLRIPKGYSSATAVSKAQAPLPPLKLPLDGWSGTSSAC